MPSVSAPTTKPNGVQPIRVLVTDNTVMGAELLAKMLERDRRFGVLETAFTPEDILRAAGEHHPDVVLLTQYDDDSPARFRTARELRASFPDIRVVVILGASSGQLVVEAFRAGAKGILARNESVKLLGKCLECVYAGNIWINNEQLKYLIDELAVCTPPRFADSKGAPLLSKQEHAVVHWMTEGLSNREIAAQLKLSEHTVKNYIFRIFDKLGVSKRVEVILYALSRRNETRQANVSTAEQSIDEDCLLFQWSRGLAEQGSAMAAFMLGQMYREGRGTQQDFGSAYTWFHFAKLGPEALRRASSTACEQLCKKMTPEEISSALAKFVEVLESKHHPEEQIEPTPLLPASPTV
ncbi:MAG TPA: LuxR C-terminal-related transcriptional regulator [Terriglobia bacterium]|nr:LuxR C-terminal-related transcriptional regulator [Terriglobia bacterium]